MCLGLPDGRLRRHLRQLIAALDAQVRAHRPASLLAPWRGDAHPDHRAVGAAAGVVAAAHGLPVWAGEIWSPAPATHLADISGPPLARKRAALSAYRTAGRVLRLEAIVDLNSYRALGMPAGTEAAEAFAVERVTGWRGPVVS